MTLTEFLTARIAEDEATFTEDAYSAYDDCESYVDELHKRLRTECEAKRLIVDLHQAADLSLVAWYGDDWAGPDGLACATCGTANEYAVKWPCETLRAVALPYADHSDFDQAWKL